MTITFTYVLTPDDDAARSLSQDEEPLATVMDIVLDADYYTSLFSYYETSDSGKLRMEQL